jgi:hypothetical protein
VDWLTRFGPPHLTWLVAALLVQRDRQRWHHAVSERLRDLDDEGPVPDLPGWRYYRHGIGICLYEPGGESLDVNFNDEPGAIIDVWFFAARVDSVKDSPRWVAERRLWRWRPMREVIVDGCEELAALGAVRYLSESKNTFVLAPELEAQARDTAEDLATPGAAERWLAALEPGGEGAHVAGHRAWIRERLRTSSRAGDLLDLALHDATVDETIALCRPFLAGQDWAAGHAIALLRGRPEVPALPEVAALLRRASATEDHPFAPYQACAYLIERGLSRELALERFDAWSQLDEVTGYHGHPLVEEFAIFALRLIPGRAMQLVRQALRNAVPLGVQRMAGLLAAIDQRWCHRELAAALAGPRRASHSYLAAALRRTSSDLARRRADADPGPQRAPDAIGYSFEEIIHARANDEIEDDLAEWRPLAAILRARYPEDWDGAWPI